MASLVSFIPQDLFGHLRAYWRRRWVILGSAWLLSIIGWLVVAIIPNQYQSMTRIYVETENLLTPLLKNIAVESDLQKQLEVMQRTLLNRNNLAQVARVTDLDLKVHGQAETEEQYERLRKKIQVKAEGRNLFSVTFSDSDPVLAKKVVESLLNIFVETNLGQNRANMESARTFIETQIADYEQKLAKADQRLAEFKGRNTDVLMAIGGSFSARLEQARQDVSTARIKLNEATILRDQLRAHLAGVPQFLDIDSQPQVVVAGGGTIPSLEGRIKQLENDLISLQTTYTDNHPDVIATKRSLEQLRATQEREAKRPGAERSSGRNRMPNAVYEQIKLRLVQADGDVATAKAQLDIAGENVQRLSGLAETAPKIEAELADLNREYGVLKSKYEELLARRESARISEAVETSGDKVQFRIIEAPQVPVRPSFPNRPLLVAAVLAVALGAGGGLAFLLQKLDDTVTSPEVITDVLHARLLGMVPKVENLQRTLERQRSVRRFAIASSSLFATFAVVLVLTQYFEQFAQMVMRWGGSGIVERILNYAG